MKKKGFAGGPFQLLIGIVVFGMALVIGAYLFNMINCWRCDELLKIEATDLKEAIASVGKGDVNSKKNLVVELKGSCAKGIYLNKVSNCASICYAHPNDCWVVLAESRCTGLIMRECIDISGDVDIESTLGKLSMPDEPWLDQSYAFVTAFKPIKIEKTGPTSMEISEP
jgi:hypothetical protein